MEFSLDCKAQMWCFSQCTWSGVHQTAWGLVRHNFILVNILPQGTHHAGHFAITIWESLKHTIVLILLKGSLYNTVPSTKGMTLFQDHYVFVFMERQIRKNPNHHDGTNLSKHYCMKNLTHLCLLADPFIQIIFLYTGKEGNKQIKEEREREKKLVIS